MATDALTYPASSDFQGAMEPTYRAIYPLYLLLSGSDQAEIPVYLSGSLFVRNDVSIGSTLHIGNEWDVKEDGNDLVFYDDGNQEILRIGDTSSSYQLKVTGDTKITGDLEVDGDEIIGGDLTVDNIHVTNSATIDNDASIGNDLTVGDDAHIIGDAAIDGELTVLGNVTLGNNNADAIIVQGIFRARNGTGTFSLIDSDPANQRVILLPGAALASDTTPAVQVRGRLYVAPETSNDHAIQWRRDVNLTAGWWLGEASDGRTVFKDKATDTAVFYLGQASDTYQAYVIGDLSVLNNIDVGDDISADRVFIGAVGPSGLEELRVVGQTRLEGSLTVTTGGYLVTGNSTVTGDLNVTGALTAGSFSPPSGNFTITGGDVRLDNTHGVSIKDTAVNYRLVLQVDSSDRARFGFSGLAAHVDGSSINLNAATTVTGALSSTTTVSGVDVVATTGNVAASAGKVTASTALIAGGTTQSGSEKLRVVSGTSRLEGNVDITTGGLTLSAGNLVFGTTSQRITGPYDNATIASRPMFMSSTTNGFTFVGAIPNGSSRIAGFAGYNHSTPTSGTTIQLYMNGTTAGVLAVADDGGGALPLQILTNNVIRQTVETNGNIGLFGTSGSYGSGVKVLYVGNAGTNPSTNPSNGALMFADSGALKARGSGGTTATLCAADPHCPECGRDFVLEWTNDAFGALTICAFCLTEGMTKGVMKREIGSRGY